MLLSTLCTLMTARAQTFQWVTMGNGPGWKHANAIALDGNGNAIVVGEFSGNNGVTFDGTTLTAAGSESGFIAVYSSNGSLVNAKQIGPTSAGLGSAATATGVAIAPDNSYYVTGECSGLVDFGGIAVSTPTGGKFIAHYLQISAGAITFDWVMFAKPDPTSPNSGFSRKMSVAVDQSDGSVYICGTYTGTVQFDGAVSSGRNSPPASDSAIYLTKYDSTGKLMWIGTAMAHSPGSGSATGTAVAVMSSIQKVVVTGHFNGTIDLKTTNGPSPYPLYGNSRGTLLLARFDADGLGIAATKIEGTGTSPVDSILPSDIAVDNANNIYVVGSFRGKFIFNGPPLETFFRDYFILSYTSGLMKVWSGQGSIDLTGDCKGNGVAVINNNVYVTGTFAGNMKIGWYPLGSIANHDIFVAKYSTSGIPAGALRAGNVYNASDPPNHYDQGIAIDARKVGADDIISVTGEFGGDAHFPGGQTLSDIHPRNIFIGRIAPISGSVTGTLSHHIKHPQNLLVEVNNQASLDMDHATTDVNGAYYLPLYPGTFQAHVLNDLIHWNWSPAPSASFGGSANSGINFSGTPKPTSAGVTDLRISMTVQSTEYATNGREVRYLIRYQNVGTVPAFGSTITLCHDQLLNYDTEASNPSVSHGGTGVVCPPETADLTWTIPFIDTLEGGTIEVVFGLDRDTLPTRSLYSEAHISNAAENRITGYDNTARIKQEVVQPLDPNGKFVAPKGTVGVSRVRDRLWLTYTITFYNKGQGIARHVLIEDDLDQAFDVDDINDVHVESYAPGILDASFHPPHTLQFMFKEANLQPVEKSVPASQGFITFSLPLHTSKDIVPIGAMVPNLARITFFNPDSISVGTMSTPEAANCVNADFSYKTIDCARTTQFTTLTADNIDYLPYWARSGSFRWDFGDGGTSTDRNPVHVFPYSGSYVVTLRFDDSLGGGRWMCDEFIDSVYMVRKIVVIAPHQPEPLITATTGPGGATFSSTTGPGWQYQWYCNGTMLDGQTAPTLTVKDYQGREFTVCVRDSAGCLGCSNKLTLAVGAEGASGRQLVSLHPNPGSGLFTLDLAEPARRDSRFAITAMTGETIIERPLAAGMRSCAIDLSGFPSGIYLLRLSLGGIVTTQRLVLVR